MNIRDKMEELGISRKASKVYLTLLKMGSGTVMDIAYKADINRCTVYDLLESLSTRKLVTHAYKGKKRIFIAQHPENLNYSIQQQHNIVTDILPELSKYFEKATAGHQRIEYHEGIEGIVYANEQLLHTTEKEYHYFGSVKEMTEIIGHYYLEEYVTKRIKKGIWSNAIRVRDRETDHTFMQSGEKNLRRVRYFPKKLDENVAALYITDSRVVVISSMNEGFGLIIDSPELITLMKMVWKMLWEVAEE